MKKFNVIALSALMLCSAAVSAETMSFNGTTYNVTRTTKQLASGVKYHELIVDRGSSTYTSGSRIHIVEADLTDPTVSIKHGDSGRDSRRSLTTQAANVSTSTATCVAAANANFWVTTETPWATKVKYEPHGVSIKDGHMYTDPNCNTTAHVGGPTVTGMLAVNEDGRVFIDYLKPQLDNAAAGSGWNFQITNNTHPHTFLIDQVNRVSVPGTASLYTSIYPGTKAFRPVVGIGDYSTSTLTDWTELLMDFADGTTEWNIGGTTNLVIKEIRRSTNGQGTRGSYDCALVANMSFADVMSNWAVGDQMTITSVVNFASKGSPGRIMQATSGNCIAMANGVIGYDSSQESYNKSNYARTLYGTNDDGTKLWIAVCEHNPAQQKTYLGFSTKAMAEVLKHEGATWATQVDCGGSAQMYAGGKQVSKSTDSGGLRNVQSGIFILSSENNSGGGEEPNPDQGTIVTPSNPALGTMNPYLHYADVEIAQLLGKTIKKVIPAHDGEHLYILAHDASNSATVLVYNHKTKTVKEQLGTSGLISGRVHTYVSGGLGTTGDVMALGDIALTDDGYLVGVGRSQMPFQTSTAYPEGPQIYTYAWRNKDSNGIVTGNVAATNVGGKGVYATANLYQAESGRYMDYSGTLASGTMYISCVDINTSTAYRTRVIRWNFADSNGDGSGDFGAGASYGRTADLGEKTTTYVKSYLEDGYINIFPGNLNKVVINSATHNPTEFTLSATSGNPAGHTVGGTTSVLPKARHTPIFEHGGNYYMIAPTSTGVAVANVTSGLASASAVTVDATALSSYSTTNVAAAGTSLDSDNYALFVLRDGKLSKYSTEAPIPVAPVLSGEAYESGEDAYGLFTWTKPEYTSGFDTEQYVNGEWVAFQYGFGENFTRLDWKMPDQTSKTWTLRVRATNATGASPWSNEVTVRVLNENSPVINTSITGSTALTGNTTDASPAYFDIVVTADNLATPMTYSASNEAVTVAEQDDWNEFFGGTLRVSVNPDYSEGIGNYNSVITIVSDVARADVPCTVALSGPTSDIIAFAYDLSATKLSENTFAFTFTLNRDVENAKLVLTTADETAGSDGVIEVDYGALAAGEQTFEYTVEYPYTYSWEVVVDGHAVTESTLVYSAPANYTNTAKSPRGGVVTFTDPEYDNFGYTLVGHGCANGFDFYAADLAQVGTRSGLNASGLQNSNASSVFRGVERKGKAIFCDWADASRGLWIVDPQDATYVTPMYEGANGGKGDNILNGVSLGGGNTSVAFNGEYMYSFIEDYGSDGKKLVRYNIGDVEKISVAPDYVYATASSKLAANGNVHVVATDKGMFLSQVRGVGNPVDANDTEANPALMFVDYSGNILLISSNIDDILHSSSGVAVNRQNDMLAISEHSSLIKVFSIAWNGNTPTLTYLYSIENSTLGAWSHLNFDYAGNLHAYSLNNGYRVFSIKNNNPTVSTPARAEYMVTGGISTGVEDVNAESVEDEVIYYNLQGLQVDDENLTPGIYIKVQGNRSSKVLIR